MLSLFKTNNPAVVLFYALYLAAFRIYFWIVPVNTEDAFKHQEPLSNWLFGNLLRVSVDFSILSVVLGGLLCFIQALAVNNIVNSNKILARKNYLPGAFFVIFASFFPDFLSLTAATVAFTFLIFATGKMFSIIRKEKVNGDIYDIGFLVAIAALFYFPALIYVLFAFIGLGTVRAFSYREWIILLLGFLTPFLVAFTFYFWNDETNLLLHNIANIQPKNWLSGLSFTISQWILIGSLLVVLLYSLAMLPTTLYSSNIQTRKFVLLLVLFVILVPVSFTLMQEVHLAHLVFFSLPLAIICSMLLTQSKSIWFGELFYLILILLLLAGQYLPVLKIIES